MARRVSLRHRRTADPCRVGPAKEVLWLSSRIQPTACCTCDVPDANIEEASGACQARTGCIERYAGIRRFVARCPARATGAEVMHCADAGHPNERPRAFHRAPTSAGPPPRNARVVRPSATPVTRLTAKPVQTSEDGCPGSESAEAEIHGRPCRRRPRATGGLIESAVTEPARGRGGPPRHACRPAGRRGQAAWPADPH